MGYSTLQNVRFAGMACCVPRRVLDNLIDCPPQMRLERERLVRNIGIRNRRICHEWQCFSDLALEAAERLIVEVGWNKEDIDALIVVSQSPDYPMPSTAIILQDRLGLPHSTIAFDVNLGCSGYPFGLHLLGSMIAAGGVKKGLLLVGDKCASIMDPIFSDAGTATALEFNENSTPMYFDLNSDGSGHKAIILPVGAHREPVGLEHLIPNRDQNYQKHWPGEFQLDGPAVLSFSTQRIPPAIVALLKYANLTSDEIDYFVFHQANKMINETIRKKLGLPVEKTPTTLSDFGNTSGASLPITIAARLRDILSSSSCRLMLSGFGIGLSWGSCILTTDNGAKFLEIMES